MILKNLSLEIEETKENKYLKRKRYKCCRHDAKPRWKPRILIQKILSVSKGTNNTTNMPTEG